MADLSDVMRELGRITEGVSRLREDFNEEKKTAAESRKVLYQRQEDVTETIGSLKTDIGINASVTVQTREEIKNLSSAMSAHKKEIQPTIDEWHRMKTLGVGLAGLLAFGGLSVGAVIMWTGEAVASAVRRWLGI